MGTKEVLDRTPHHELGLRHALHRTAAAMRADLPARLDAGPRVIKRNRGNGGQGVWKVETPAGPRSRPTVRVLDATKDGIGRVDAGRVLNGAPSTSKTAASSSTVPKTSERRRGTLLHGRRSLRWLWLPEGQGAGRRTGSARRGWTAALHLQRRPAFPAPASINGRRVDAAADFPAGHAAARHCR